MKAPPPPTSPKKRIFQKISDVFNVDFSQYKDATILRRLERRMALRGITEMKDYAEILESEAEEEELDHLYRDLLIDVTSFFRDTEAFSFIEEQVLPEILQNHPEEQEFRVWVVACASGEEAYSMAIMLQEILGRTIRTEFSEYLPRTFIKNPSGVPATAFTARKNSKIFPENFEKNIFSRKRMVSGRCVPLSEGALPLLLTIFWQTPLFYT